MRIRAVARSIARNEIRLRDMIVIEREDIIVTNGNYEIALPRSIRISWITLHTLADSILLSRPVTCLIKRN